MHSFSDIANTWTFLSFSASLRLMDEPDVGLTWAQGGPTVGLVSLPPRWSAPSGMMHVSLTRGQQSVFFWRREKYGETPTTATQDIKRRECCKPPTWLQNHRALCSNGTLPHLGYLFNKSFVFASVLEEASGHATPSNNTVLLQESWNFWHHYIVVTSGY